MKKKILLPLLFLCFLVLFGFIVHLAGQPEPSASAEDARKAQCVLDYGEPECFNEKLNIPFYNAGTKTISYAEITVPTTQGADIAMVREKLEPKETGAVETTACSMVDKSRNLKVKWCCEKCYEAEMTEPSSAVRLESQAG